MKSLDPNYTVEIDKVGKDEWTTILEKFDDSNIYQTWPYGAIKWGEKNLSHTVLKKNGEVVAVTQCWVKKIPIFNSGIAYIKWGPLWKQNGKGADFEIFLQMIRALREEYAKKRGLLLRVLPAHIGNDTDTIDHTMLSEGFENKPPIMPYRTIFADLRPSLEEIRKSLKRSWRINLKKAERKGLEVWFGESNELFEVFLRLYKEMVGRKKFVDFVDVDTLRLIHKDLPVQHKIRLAVCRYKDEPIAVIMVSLLGTTAIYLHGATGNAGLPHRGSFLLHWRMIEWLKEHSCCWYDLNGIDPENNPGGYQFKSGLAGKFGKDVFFNEFEICYNKISLLIFKISLLLRRNYRNTKKAISNLFTAFRI